QMVGVGMGDEYAGQAGEGLPALGEHARVEEHASLTLGHVQAGVAVLGDLHEPSLPAPAGERRAGQWVTIHAAMNPNEFVAQCSSMVVLMPLPSRASAHISTPAATIDTTASTV